MGMTPEEILRTAGYAGTPVAYAAAYSIISNHRRNGTSDLTVAQNQFLQDVKESAAARPKKVTSDNPLANVRPRNYPPKPGDSKNEPNRSLSPSEVAYLQRLPQNPTALSNADAKTLLQLWSDVDNPGDRAFLDLIAGPVMDHHAIRQAKAELTARAETPLAQLPNSALAALAEAIGAAEPALQPHEAVQRARTALDEYTTARRQNHAAELTNLQRRVDDLQERADGRTQFAEPTASAPQPA